MKALLSILGLALCISTAARADDYCTKFDTRPAGFPNFAYEEIDRVELVYLQKKLLEERGERFYEKLNLARDARWYRVWPTGRLWASRVDVVHRDTKCILFTID